jgi:ribosomal protein S7
MWKFSKVDVIISPKTNEREEKIINYLMKDGKKAVAKRIYNDMLKEVKTCWTYES